MLFNSDPGDLHSLRDLARRAEKVLKDNKAPIDENRAVSFNPRVCKEFFTRKRI